MKRSVLAAMAAAVWLMGCGGGGSLPPGEQPTDPTLPDPPVVTPPDKPNELQTLWPLTTGSTWTYRINDPVRGVFDKQVEVLGQQQVPETNLTATAVRSTQPHLEELSWQLELQSGVVVRLREEDLKGGALARVTTWSPATVKALAKEQQQGWTYESTIRELTRLGDGTTEDKERTYRWRVISVNETVTVPAGTFTNVIKIQRDRPDKDGKERIYWLVRGIGKIKEDGERLEELVSHDVKK